MHSTTAEEELVTRSKYEVLQSQIQEMYMLPWLHDWQLPSYSSAAGGSLSVSAPPLSYGSQAASGRGN